MELHAAGFNAFDQLRFGDREILEEEPDDLHSFTCVLEDKSIELRAFLSYTSVNTSSARLRSSGCVPASHQLLRSRDPTLYATFAEASNGSVVVFDRSGVREYRSLHNLLAEGQHRTFNNLPRIAQAVAHDTGFAVLGVDGSVLTWGDERYAPCLGRDVSDASPADEPGLVTALQDLPTGPITKIAAGGYVLAALTAGDDLYLWGGRPNRPTVPAEVTGEPSPVVIADKDILDVGVGESHLIVLTTEGEVYVIGDNGNGQLGLPVKSLESWEKVDLQGMGKVLGVTAGPRCSFIVARKAGSS